MYLSKSLPQALISIEKMVGSTIFICSLAITASLAVYIQHTEEQYSTSMFLSLDPTHWRKPIFLGIVPSEGRIIFPENGPLALRIRSN
ncbi:hypothetical protein ES705_50109 [subsurface metagenome]